MMLQKGEAASSRLPATATSAMSVLVSVRNAPVFLSPDATTSRDSAIPESAERAKRMSRKTASVLFPCGTISSVAMKIANWLAR